MSHFLRPIVAHAAEPFALCVEGQGAPFATALEAAFDSASRKRGLLGRQALPEGAALIIAPCNLVHTFRMQFAIDVLFVARDGRVLKVREALGPNRIAGSFRAFATIELPAGTAAQHGLVVGQRVELRA